MNAASGRSEPAELGSRIDPVDGAVVEIVFQTVLSPVIDDFPQLFGRDAAVDGEEILCGIQNGDLHLRVYNLVRKVKDAVCAALVLVDHDKLFLAVALCFAQAHVGDIRHPQLGRDGQQHIDVKQGEILGVASAQGYQQLKALDKIFGFHE